MTRRPNCAADRATIIAVNDRLRTTFQGGEVRVAPSIYQLDARLCGRALCVMSRQRNFDERSEHDRGRFVFAGYAFEWCIEYQSSDGTAASPDPADPNRTFRVLTLSAVDDLLIRRTFGLIPSASARPHNPDMVQT